MSGPHTGGDDLPDAPHWVRAARDARPSPPGLVLGCISPRRFARTLNVQVEMYRRDTKVRLRPYGGYPRPVGGRRGQVNGFTAASRRRARFTLNNACVEWKAIVTLTYPRQYPSTAASKEHLQALLDRLRRRFPGFHYFWVLEFQRRGAPHYHLLVDVRIPREWLARAWFEIVGSGDERHLRAGVRIEAPRSQDGVRAYVSKYLSKLDQKDAEGWTGRYWGSSRGLVQMQDVEQYEAEPWVIGRLIRPLRKFKEAKHRANCYPWRFRGRGFTLYNINPKEVEKLLYMGIVNTTSEPPPAREVLRL